jgi:uncharacterized membrane protein
MKPAPTQIVLVIVLLAAVFVSHMYAPTSISVVTSIVSTLIGAFFVDLRRKEPEEAPAVVETARVLKLVPPKDDSGEAS